MPPEHPQGGGAYLLILDLFYMSEFFRKGHKVLAEMAWTVSNGKLVANEEVKAS